VSRMCKEDVQNGFGVVPSVPGGLSPANAGRKEGSRMFVKLKYVVLDRYPKYRSGLSKMVLV